MKLEFTLRQHTPIIHFQHDQEGATIRATELKPRLDRFIVEHVFDNNFDRCKEFLVGYSRGGSNALRGKFDNDGYRALDYKVRISVASGLAEADERSLSEFEKMKLEDDGTPRQKRNRTSRELQSDDFGAPIYERQNFPSFFGNMDKETMRKELRESEKLLVRMYFRNEVLMQHVDSVFPLFLQQANFGTRQSKGFGCFYLHEDDPRYEGVPLDARFHFSVNVGGPRFSTEFGRIRELFRVIDLFYKTLRSGINLKGHGGTDVLYFKSLMFLYAKERGLQWDKKTIRDHFFSRHPAYRSASRRPGRNDPQGTFSWASDDIKFLFRDLLGLSSRQEWSNYGAVVVKESLTRDQDGEPAVARFKSPLLFKPIWNPTDTAYEVYIIPKEISRGYLRESFVISNERDNSQPSLPLKIYEDFSVNEYLDFCFKRAFCQAGTFDEARFDAHVISAPANREAATLKAIFLQLSQQ